MQTRRILSYVAAFALLGSAAAVRADETIGFEEFNEGDIVSTVTIGGIDISVLGENPAFPGQNAAMIFDSACSPSGTSADCSGDDPDLGTPNQDFGGPGAGAGGESGSPNQNDTPLGNVLIVSEDLDSNDPDDADNVGASISFDFSNFGTVTMKSIDLVDVEAVEPDAQFDLYDETDTLIASITAPSTGDNGVATIGLGPTSGVAKMVVTLNGSGAIDNIVFDTEEGGDGCTPGYWKVRKHLDSWTGVAPNDNFNATFGTNASFNADNCTRPDGVGSSNPTLLKALWCEGGGLNALARHGVAALLNALNPDVDYALSAAEVKTLVHDAIVSGNYADAKNRLADQNEMGCPLN